MRGKIIFAVGFLIAAIVFFCACNFTKQSDVNAKEKKTVAVEQVNHKITYDQVEQMRGAYKGNMVQSSFEIEQVRELINQPEAKWLGFSPGHSNGKDVPILTIYDANKVELKNFGLELSMGCPPNCLSKQVARK